MDDDARDASTRRERVPVNNNSGEHGVILRGGQQRRCKVRKSISRLGKKDFDQPDDASSG